MIKIAVLASGSGSNLQAIIDACKNKTIDGSVVLVISDKKDAYALKRAKDALIESIFIDPKSFPSKGLYETEVVKAIKKSGADLVCLAGYMKIVGDVMLSNYKGKTINIHPALLPSFPGLHAQKQAFDYGVKVSGATVHFVDEGCDTGPIIIQSCVKVFENDTEESLQKRILDEEHKIYPEAIRLFAEGKLKIEGKKVKIL